MKRILSLALATVLLVSALLTMTACGSPYSKIEGRFVEAGYTVVDTTDSDGANYLSFVSALDDGEVSGTVHILKAGKLLQNNLRFAVIIEFNADADAQAAMAEYLQDNNLKGYFDDIQSSDCVNGNCILIPVIVAFSDSLATEMINTFKG